MYFIHTKFIKLSLFIKDLSKFERHIYLSKEWVIFLLFLQIFNFIKNQF